MIDYEKMLSFYNGRRVLLTGHTGFKGSWLSRILLNAGAIVTGYAMEPPSEPNLFIMAGIEQHSGMTSVIGDVRDLDGLKQCFRTAKPEVVFHLAAQPIVRTSYQDPVGTYQTNVMGTVNLFECVRLSVPGQELNAEGKWSGVHSVLNVTTDKVYENKEWCWGYREDEPLDGFDPYSNSKSCSELVTHSYRNSFFSDDSVRISTARAGNVIGGGDFAKDRIIPDCVRALADAQSRGEKKASVIVRNPKSTRPYQHVLEPLFAYLTIAKMQYEDAGYAGYYNVGPDESDCVTTATLVELFCRYWNEQNGDVSLEWEDGSGGADQMHEANYLKLDCSKMRSVFGWSPRWHIEQAVTLSARLADIWLNSGSLTEEMDWEIFEYGRTKTE